MLDKNLIFLLFCPIHEGAVEKVSFLPYTPIPIAIGTPRGDLFKSNKL